MIDGPAIMVVAGFALQAANPARAIVANIRQRRRSDEVVAALPFTPLPRPSADLDQLLASLD